MEAEQTMPETQLFTTAAELLQMSREDVRHELVQGVLREMSPAGFPHGWFVMNVSTPLDLYVRTHKLGRVSTAETGYLLARNPDTVRAPDVGFLCRERIPSMDFQGYWNGAPDLAVEVVSPNDLYTEVEAKVFDYLSAGTRMVVIVNPRRRTLKVHRPDAPVADLMEHDVLDGGQVVPGWTLPVAAIFE